VQARFEARQSHGNLVAASLHQVARKGRHIKVARKGRHVKVARKGRHVNTAMIVEVMI
jgi:hypothetical protein